MTKITSYNIIFLLLLFILGCADPPSHSNIFDPDTPNEDPTAVELRTDLIKDMTNHSITFNWTESGDEDFYSYKIYRSAQPGVDTSSILLGTHQYPFLNAITDTGLQPNIQYCYKVYTEDKGGLITGSNELCVSTVPDIYYCFRLSQEGAGTEDFGLNSKMDVVPHNGTSNVCFAIIERGWTLRLYGRSFDPQDPLDTGSNSLWVSLIEGDTDGDGAPDLYEIFASTDPYDNYSYPELDVDDYVHLAPTQIVIFKGENSSSTTIFVLLREQHPFYNCKILKFSGNWDDEYFSLDSSWSGGVGESNTPGVIELRPCNTIARYATNRLLIGAGWWYKICDLEGNVYQNWTEVDVYTGVSSVGKDSPAGESYIYLSNWNGEIFKYDYDGNLEASWQGFEYNSGSLVPIGLFADHSGNVFISDPGLNTVNRYDSEGQLLSRWGGINTEFNYPFYFAEQNAVHGQGSVMGDNNNNLFIIDMHSYRARATY
jgi:hypothetical protein|tara:strand:- start:380 stop:1834 length:1455 start_codon:yes stop_codon:yes gene_type:complete